jgi:hypothetical protein
MANASHVLDDTNLVAQEEGESVHANSGGPTKRQPLSVAQRLSLV